VPETEVIPAAELELAEVCAAEPETETVPAAEVEMLEV
jgi:hypothetical protein